MLEDLLHDYIASQFNQTSAEFFNHGFNIRDLYFVYAYIKNEIYVLRHNKSLVSDAPGQFRSFISIQLCTRTEEET